MRRPLLFEGVFSESAGCCKGLWAPISSEFTKASHPGRDRASAAGHSPSRPAYTRAA